MTWFDDLKQALPAYYPAGSLPDVVGYLRGSKDQKVWRNMELTQQRTQKIILGSRPPSPQEWAEAGVSQRGSDQTITFNDLLGFIVLYAGFQRRPWGAIHILSAEGLRNFPMQIADWKRLYKPPSP